MSKRLHTTLPMVKQQRVPKVVNVSEFQEKEKHGKELQCTDFNRHRGARELSPLQPGDEVWIPDRQSNGQVVEEANPRSYRLPGDDSEEHDVPAQEESREPVSNPVERHSYTTQSQTGKLPQPPDRYEPSWN